MSVKTVNILATLRHEELLGASTMVFKSLRVGLPSASVRVFLNEPDFHPDTITKAAEGAGCQVIPIPRTIHHAYILELTDHDADPFLICDTDITFWRSIEDWDFGDAAMAGKFIPEFYDKFTRCITRPRLHTSLLYLNPARIKEQVEKYFAQFPDTPFNPRPNLIFPAFFPFRTGALVKNHFFDTAALLYNAIGGECFTPSQLDCYDHLGFGTISDLVAPHYPEECWREQHFAAMENPNLMRGSWRHDAEFYARHAVST